MNPRSVKVRSRPPAAVKAGKYYQEGGESSQREPWTDKILMLLMTGAEKCSTSMVRALAGGMEGNGTLSASLPYLERGLTVGLAMKRRTQVPQARFHTHTVPS